MSDQNAYWAGQDWKPQTGKECAVMFQTRSVRNKFKSEQQEKDVFDEKVFIIKIPADIKLRIERPIRKKDMKDYPREWEQFLRTKETRPLGIPIDKAPFLSETQKDEFRSAKIMVIEQIANMTDSMCQRMMGGIELRRKAQLYLNQDSTAEAKKEIDDLKSQLAEMRALLEKATSPTTAA